MFSTLRKLAQLASRPSFSATYIGGGKTLVRLQNGFKMYVLGDDLSLGCHLIVEGIWEPATGDVIRTSLRQGDRAIEVGANFGVHSLAIASCVGVRGSFLAFEANSELAGIARDNLEINGLLPQSTVLASAASDSSGELTFHRFRAHRGSSSLIDLAAVAAQVGDSVEAITVPATTIDEQTADWPHANLLKIDAEGWEIHVLRGAQKLIERSPDIRLLIEINGASKAMQVYKFLQTNGFVICPIVHGTPPTPYRAEMLDSIQTATDALCYRPTTDADRAVWRANAVLAAEA